ncbi:hypothetical protein D3C80_912750 [compost metagenome]
MHLRVYIFREADRTQQVVDLIARKSIIHPVIKDDFNNGKPKHGRTADTGSLLNRTHAQFNRGGHKAFYLFGTTAIPLGDDGNLCIGDIWKCLNRHTFETYKASNSQNTNPNKGERFIFYGKGNDIFNEFVHSRKKLTRVNYSMLYRSKACC